MLERYDIELKEHRNLLDEAMSMDKKGLISTNLAEKIADAVTESPNCVTAEPLVVSVVRQ